MKYADIVIDNKTDSTDRPYTYACGELTGVRPGSKVYVPFARSKDLREGYVLSVMDEAEAEAKVGQKILAKIRSIDHVDEEISLTEECVRTAAWMRDRYVCRYIDALRCFLPAGRKRVRRTAAGDEKAAMLSGIGFHEEDEEVALELTEEQTAALEQIRTAIDAGSHSRFLLHGVTARI